ncbi:hypothetical protein DNTS_034162 [Danionella cerebrum]|uniref:NIDO domain-containing protein n=1 Tax=Danionella cerebrum TaxID=2873325 RepID=A0A553QKP9_9TELE|nr:hypothetical protein DNTS_034162 [Danionella translucida]
MILMGTCSLLASVPTDWGNARRDVFKMVSTEVGDLSELSEVIGGGAAADHCGSILESGNMKHTDAEYANHADSSRHKCSVTPAMIKVQTGSEMREETYKEGMGKPVLSYVFVLLSLLAGKKSEGKVPDSFLPVGNGDTRNPVSDDGSSPPIILQQPLQYFGNAYDQIFVNNNGQITFTEPMYSYSPILKSKTDVIAPIWTDLDNRRGGTISYRVESSSAALAKVTDLVNEYFPGATFIATSAFVATWDSVPYYDAEGAVTVQVILAYNAHRTFILFNYGEIGSTVQNWMAGYYTMDSVHSFSIPVKTASELYTNSNINVSGHWSFKVDGSPILPSSFIDPDDVEILNPTANNGSSGAISLLQPFRYFGRTYHQIFVNSNGYLTFTEQLATFNPFLISRSDVIAPLLTQLDNRNGGTITYKVDTGSVMLDKVKTWVNQYFPNIPFVATSVFVATWSTVPYSSGGGVVNFQVVLAYNVHRSFILINYGDVARTGQTWQAGYKTEDGVNNFVIAANSTQELSSRSNVNVTSRWCFPVDGAAILPANFLPFGKGEMITPRLDNGSSEGILLQMPFKFFGRSYNQTFVSNNGLLTFTEAVSDCIPFLHSGRDLIAPLWTHVDIRKGGTVSYRQDTSSDVLAQVTSAVKQNYPNITFAALSAFVATWDSVPYYSGEGAATFQVVLVSSVQRSFILINYGNITHTDQTWLAGYDTADSVNSFTIPVSNASDLSYSSNTNVNGCSSFHVDGSPNLPKNFLTSGDEVVVNPTANNGSSDAISLQQPFKFFGRVYSRIFVNSNGYLTFTEPLSVTNPIVASGRDVIAPLWTHLDSKRGGTISYKEYSSSSLLAQVTAAVNRYFPSVPFAATSVFVATWDNVPYYDGGGVATFQVLLAYNVHRSFILMYYGDVAGTVQTWQAGYRTEDGVNNFVIAANSTQELSSRSNVNVTSRWCFPVDGAASLPANFLPFGKGEMITPRLDNGSSEGILLQMPFKFFGRSYNQTFVSNNGLLTFTEAVSDCIPFLHSGRDLIAPLWTHVDIRKGGTVSYRQDTSSDVLAQVTSAVKQNYPNITFAALSAFVATWDSVPYYSGEGAATFQVVLVSSVQRSFILINYGNITHTDQTWLVSGRRSQYK